MGLSKYFVIISLLIITIPISAHNVYAELQPQIRIINCPQDTLVGERGIFTLQISNQENSKLIIKNMDFGINGDFQGNETNSRIILNHIEIPFSVDPHDAITLNGNFRTEVSGIHYIDLNLLYYLENFVNNEFSLTKEICEIKVVPSESSFDAILTGIIIAGVSAGFAGLATSIVKIFFVRKNFKFEQNVLSEKRQHEKLVEHQHWLFQKMHSLAEKYYIPLAKFAWDAMQNISISSTSKNKQAIDIAYNDISLFLRKYTDFKITVGANYIFLDREFERPAINKAQAILTGLPFDEMDIDKIVLNASQSEKKYQQTLTTGIPYKHFSQWIKSDFCSRSRMLVKKKLNEFQKILDEQGERISSPDYFDQKNKKEPEQSSTPDVNIWISYLSSKICHPGQEIFVYGNGFEDSSYKYKFYLKEELVPFQKLNNNTIKISIPKEIPKGTYDLYARGNRSDENEFETIGIAVHIE